jgi:hypothetical protein
MTDTDRSESELFTATKVGAPALAPDQPDSALLALESQFNALAAELAAARGTRGEFAICRHQPPEWNEQADVDVGSDYEARTRELEEILARLDPIERAIMATKALTIAGLGVKARHAAYVTSQYWNEPIDKIDWESRAVRLLIEAVCDAAPRPLP